MTKPTITAFEGGAGRHNQDLEGARTRIVRSGSWKKQRVVVIIPAGDSVPAPVVMTWLSLVFPPNQPVMRILAQGMEVGDAYSTTIEQVITHPELRKWEYILTLEHDNMPPPAGVLQLLQRMEERKDLACIGGLYFTKGEGGVPQIWGDVNDPVLNFRPQPPQVGQLVECCGTGMGFNLWRMAMFKDERLPRPLFKTLAGSQGVGTQDLQFWSAARGLGYRCAVDCSVLVGHFDSTTGLVW